jgi:hypothetical protein
MSIDVWKGSIWRPLMPCLCSDQPVHPCSKIPGKPRAYFPPAFAKSRQGDIAHDEPRVGAPMRFRHQPEFEMAKIRFGMKQGLAVIPKAEQTVAIGEFLLRPMDLCKPVRILRAELGHLQSEFRDGMPGVCLADDGALPQLEGDENQGHQNCKRRYGLGDLCCLLQSHEMLRPRCDPALSTPAAAGSPRTPGTDARRSPLSLAAGKPLPCRSSRGNGKRRPLERGQ